MTSAIDQSTVPLLPTKDTALRLRHFDPSVYNVDESSNLYSFVDALIGDAGVGTLKKQLLINRLNQSLDTTHFTDLDTTFGNIFKIARLASEIYPYSPATDLLTTDQWAEVQVKDAWYRARIKTFFTALGLGGTPDGLRMMIKSALGVDTEVYEMWRFQDNYDSIYGINDLESIENLIPNPSFEYDTVNWYVYYGGSGATITSTSALSAAVQSGSSCLLFNSGTSITGPGVACYSIPISSGKTYTFSFYYYKPSSNTQTTLRVTYSFGFSDGSTSTVTPADVTMTSSSLTRAAFTFTAPTNAISIGFIIQTETAAITTTAMSIYFDSFMLQSGSSLNSYFDGNTSGYRWMGQPGLSASILASPIDALSRSKVPSRSEFILYPHKTTISTLEMIQARRMVRRLAPVNSVVTIANQGYAINTPIRIILAKADSTFFQMQQYVTGAIGSQMSFLEEPNTTKRWLTDGQERLAPVSAFNQPQEYSEYYLYSADINSAIDSINYFAEDSSGNSIPQKNYQSVSEAPDTWGPWTNFELADSPDNYPGGKHGHAPTVPPAFTAKAPGKPYVFAYASQQDFVNQMTVKINSVKGQVRGNIQYRLPISGTISAQNTWTPDEAIATQAPVKISSVTSSWYLRPTNNDLNTGR